MGESGMDSKNILASLRSGDDRKINTAILSLYDAVKRQTRAFVSSNSGSIEDVEDVVQDAITILYTNALAPDFQVTGSIKSYLFGICKNVWYKKLRREQRLPLDELKDYNVTEEVEDDTDDQKIALIADMMHHLSSECQRLLAMFYFERKSMTEIAAQLHYKEGNVAKSKKYKCLQALKQRVVSHPQLKDIIQ